MMAERDHGQRNYPRSDDNPHRQRPEQKHDFNRLLDSGTETDDGQRAHHAKGKDHVGRDRHDHQRSDQAEAHQGQGKARGIHHAGERLFVDEKDKQSDDQSHTQAKNRIENGEFRYVFQKTGFKDIIECHINLPLCYYPYRRQALYLENACCRSPSVLEQIGDDLRQEFVILDFQDHIARPVSGADLRQPAAKKITAEQAGPDLAVEGYLYIACRVDIGLPDIRNQYFGTKLL